MKVENMTSNKGNKIANQFIITEVLETGVVTTFQSYSTTIVKVWTDPDSATNHVKLDRDKWDHSLTTSRYRNQFLGETTKETQKKINSGEYSLVDLN